MGFRFSGLIFWFRNHTAVVQTRKDESLSCNSNSYCARKEEYEKFLYVELTKCSVLV